MLITMSTSLPLSLTSLRLLLGEDGEDLLAVAIYVTVTRTKLVRSNSFLNNEKQISLSLCP